MFCAHYTPECAPADSPLRRADKRSGSRPLLEAVGLTCCYSDSGRGIEGVNLCLERGSFTVVAGGRGAGKTTLLRALLGMLPLQGGEIRWNGVSVSGLLAPDPGHASASPRCAYLAQARPEESPSVCEGLARLLESEAELLLMDDLSAALSDQEERTWWDALFARRLFCRQRTCLAVSNRQAALSRADHILVLREGRAAGEGRLEALLEGCAELRCLWERCAWAG